MNMSRLSEASARRMSPKERLDILAKGALVFDGTKQADMLCGLLGAMTAEEMPRAMDLLAAAQDGGNACAQEVWDTLWTQWGRVDPAACIQYFAKHPDSKSRSDARFMMQGWLEADPEAALAWAKQPKETRLDVAAAAMAITWNSGGDAEGLKAALLSMPADSPVTRDCLQDYFDFASLAKDSPTATEIHDQLPDALKQAAWPVTMYRLSYTNPEAAKDWLVQHAGDPGRDYSGTYRLVEELGRKDPEGTAKWAATLPPALNGEDHPMSYALGMWIHKSPDEAQAWLNSQGGNLPWTGSPPAAE